MSRLYVIVASRSRSSAETLAACLGKYPEFRVKTRVIANGHADPLYGVRERPDLLLLHYGPGQSELQFLAEQGTNDQLPLIVCGPADDPEAMRLAMQAGACDYVPEDVSEGDLVASLSRIQEETLCTRTSRSAKLIAVVNGKGGSGASFLATNLAHSLVVDGAHRVTLVDLDLQFGGLCRYLDITPEIGILQALEVAHETDEVSAQAYTCEHSSGLRLLAAPSKRLVSRNEVPVEQLSSLLGAYLSINDYIVADAPTRLDAVTELFFDRADKIVLVVQQSLPHIQDSARLLQLLTDEVGIHRERIAVVVNRFSKNAAIELRDMRKALFHHELITIPNDYRLATEAINSGIPIAEISKNAALTKGIRKLQAALGGGASMPEHSLLTRALSSFLRR